MWYCPYVMLAIYVLRTQNWSGYSHSRYYSYALLLRFSLIMLYADCDKSVPVTTIRRVLWLRMEERPPIWSVAANISNGQPTMG